MDKTPHLEQFEESLKGWTDHRFADREDIRVAAIFSLYLVNLLEPLGYSYDGHSMNIRSPMCLLVVRGTSDGIPQVVFTSGRTPMACMRIFLRKLEGEMLEWTVDRFRG